MQNTRLSYICRSRCGQDTIAQALTWSDAPLVTVSLYGQGCFFQCIEGDHRLIDQLLDRLADLPSGFDVQIMAWHPIQQPILTHSATHYLLSDVPAQQVLEQHGVSAQDARLAQEIIDHLQRLYLLAAPDTTTMMSDPRADLMH